jgi:Tol biopolymer transport system component
MTRSAFIPSTFAAALLALALGALVSPAAATQYRPLLADTTCRDTDPTPSPDGQWLLFSSPNRGGSAEIWVMPSAGGKPKRLTSEPDSVSAEGRTFANRVMTPTWAPDGKSMLYISTRGGPYNVYSMPIEGGAATALSNAPGSQRFAVYSPDGSKICFPSSRESPRSLYGFHLYVMDAKGEVHGPPARQITKSGGSPGHPVWSPDGKWIGYVAKDVDTSRTVDIGKGMKTKETAIFAKFRVYKVSANGGPEIQLTGLTPESVPSEDTWPSWSPDGKYMAFGRNAGGKQNIWIVDTFSKKAFPLTNMGDCQKPNWSADGKSIYFTRVLNDGRDEDIWVATDVSLAGSAAAKAGAPAKKPAGTKTSTTKK